MNLSKLHKKKHQLKGSCCLCVGKRKNHRRQLRPLIVNKGQAYIYTSSLIFRHLTRIASAENHQLYNLPVSCPIEGFLMLHHVPLRQY